MTDLTELLRSAEPLTEPGFDASDVARRVHQRRARRRALATATTTAAVVSIIAILGAADMWRRPSTRVVLSPAAQEFVDVWVSTDTDGSSQTMEIIRSGDGEYEVVVRDEAATAACSNAPATMTGTGLLETEETLVIAAPELTCDDGTMPRIGPPPQAEFANFTLELDTATDELVDSFGIVWRRSGSNEQSATSGGMWPQSTPGEVRAAQERADAGDPAYTWQLDAKLDADEEPWGAEIFARFIKEELGWKKFSGASFAGHLSMGPGGGDIDGVLFIRCVPGKTNPMNPLYADAPSEIRRCAPTIDDHTYETVRLRVTQPGRRGPSGIWVVNRWEIQQSTHDSSSSYELISPDYLVDDPGRVEQVTPPSDADVTAVLRAFLRARVEGDGAEEYLLREPEGTPLREVPLLYATTRGASYERFEMKRLQGPVWPNGWMEYKVRLFAEGGETVVGQYFHVVRQENAKLRLLYGQASSDAPTIENGQAVPVPFSLLDGAVTFEAAPPWSSTSQDRTSTTLGGVGRGSASQFTMFMILADPKTGTGCELGPAPADAEALVRSIRSNADLDATDPVAFSVGGIDALRMDVVAPGQPEEGDCLPMVLQQLPLGADGRVRLYLLDLPDGMSARVLAIAISALDSEFEYVVNAAGPVLDSFEFHEP